MKGIVAIYLRMQGKESQGIRIELEKNKTKKQCMSAS
jgi:hypothetical protein